MTFFLCIKNLALVIFFHYTTEEISQRKLNVTYVFFLKTKGKLVGKIVPNGVCLCLSAKQKSPVETLKNFQNVQKSMGAFSHGALQLWLKWDFFFQLKANKCCYGCCQAQANKQVMIDEVNLPVFRVAYTYFLDCQLLL